MKKRVFAAFSVLGILFVFFSVLSISLGSVDIPIGEIADALVGKESNSVYREIIFRLRLPRIVSAAILGGALSLSGYMLQTYFHNPIAGPFILGISSGAKLTVALAMIFLIRGGRTLSSWGMILSSFTGAMLAMGFVLLMARLVNRMSILLISGVMIGYICSAFTDLMVTFASDSDIVNLHNWSKGSFSGMTWDNVLVMSIVILAVFAGTLFLSKPISAYLMGESYARSVGVNIRLFRLLLVVLSSLLAACVTAFAGPVSFVGIAVPQLIRNLFKSNRPLVLIPGCFLGGAVFCLFCDLLSRMLLAPTELSISTVTAFFGAPVVIFILLRRQSGRETM